MHSWLSVYVYQCDWTYLLSSPGSCNSRHAARPWTAVTLCMSNDQSSISRSGYKAYRSLPSIADKFGGRCSVYVVFCKKGLYTIIHDFIATRVQDMDQDCLNIFESVIRRIYHTKERSAMQTSLKKNYFDIVFLKAQTAYNIIFCFLTLLKMRN